MPKITKQFINALPPPDPDGDLLFWDDELHGYGMRMKPSGATSYCIQYRDKEGRTRRVTFAKLGAITPHQARIEATRLLAEGKSGGDPSKRHGVLTVEGLCDLYLKAARDGLVMTRHRQPKPLGTIRRDETRIAAHIVPLLGSIPADRLTKGACQRMVDAVTAGETASGPVTGGAGAARRAVELMGGIWTWGERRELVSGRNPAHGLEIFKGQPKDRTLSPDELRRLGETLRDAPESAAQAATAIRLMVLSGLRRGEALSLRWGEVDALGQCLRLELTKTGKSTRVIGRAAVRLLELVPRSCEFVFPNQTGTKPASLVDAIAKLFDAALSEHARSHDARRTFASVAADLGYSDGVIGELLGHSRGTVTSKHYIRRAPANLIAAANAVAGAIARMLDGESGAVIALETATRDHGA